MDLICFEGDGLYTITDELYKRLMSEHKKEKKWISGKEAMELLGITSKATLQKYRDENRIRFSQPDKKVIIYDRDSILKFLDDNSNRPK